MRPRPIPPLVAAMYLSGSTAALLAVSPADRLRDCVVNSVGWNSVQSAMNLSDWVHAIFNRYEVGDNPFPTHAEMRARRAYEDSLRVAPLSYLDGVALPVDLPVPSSYPVGADPGRFVVAGKPILVSVPLSGPPVVAQISMPLLATARENGLYEVAVKVKYI